MEEQSKPTIHEIAAMPYPASERAMREHYNPDWHKPIPESVTAPSEFTVDVEYSLCVTETVTVEAWTEEEALGKAAEEVAERAKADAPLYAAVEIEHCSLAKGQPS